MLLIKFVIKQLYLKNLFFKLLYLIGSMISIREDKFQNTDDHLIYQMGNSLEEEDTSCRGLLLEKWEDFTAGSEVHQEKRSKGCKI